jgi:predicted acyl esterase
LKTIPNHNGRVGISGTSYPGFYATMAALSGHPALKAISPQAPVTEWFIGDDFRHNGAVFLPHAFNFFSSFGRPQPGENEVPGPRFDYGTPDGYDFFLRMGPLGNADQKFFKGQIEWWRDFVSHDTYTDFWKSRDPLPYLKNIPAEASRRVSHFRCGYRIMVQVQSSWFPLVDRSPQRFVKIDEARPSDFQKGTQRV